MQPSIERMTTATQPVLAQMNVDDTMTTETEHTVSYPEDQTDAVVDLVVQLQQTLPTALHGLKTAVTKAEKSPETADAAQLGDAVQWQAWSYVFLGCADAALKNDVGATLKRWLGLPVRFVDLDGLTASVVSLYTREPAWLADAITRTPFPRSVHLFNAVVQVKSLPLPREDAKLIIPAAYRAADRQRWAFARTQEGLEAKRDQAFTGSAFMESLVRWLTPYSAHERFLGPFPDRNKFPDTVTYVLDIEIFLDELYDAEDQYPSSHRAQPEKLSISDVFKTTH